MLKLARAKGFSTAALGKVGPTLIFDHTDKTGADGLHSIVIDDATGGKNGVPLSEETKAALTKAGLPLATPSRGDNGKAGDARTPGTLVPNAAQQAYFADVATKVLLPMFKARNKPFVLVFWFAILAMRSIPFSPRSSILPTKGETKTLPLFAPLVAA